MKNIVVCIGNGLLSEAIIKMLKTRGEFKPFRVLIRLKNFIYAILSIPRLINPVIPGCSEITGE